jgi:hypothetical protein
MLGNRIWSQHNRWAAADPRSTLRKTYLSPYPSSYWSLGGREREELRRFHAANVCSSGQTGSNRLAAKTTRLTRITPAERSECTSRPVISSTVQCRSYRPLWRISSALLSFQSCRSSNAASKRQLAAKSTLMTLSRSFVGYLNCNSTSW